MRITNISGFLKNIISNHKFLKLKKGKLEIDKDSFGFFERKDLKLLKHS